VTTLYTFVEDTHGFIRGSNLHLHKVGLVVITGGTDGHGPIDVFPGRRAPENVVDDFAFGGGLDRAWRIN
jgi:hypothetical protein